ncbi:dTMP kinase [Chloracidobacterium sp. E]|uniref:Thymidylate kinase n=2 Tax=Chloracidobacterium TaxID=458032 RepID=A0ABX8B1Y4_9BACT|nr:dTMP kinase [Chloracidobacterium sp. 2]QUV88860.1 dTMP kinase [Chloracidobacterium sp. S]QUV91921.1 dTMP kinase [Chloracidobacterium sp. A]QUV94954.1 dTMP kinase [Chloracidobacterium sp. N]QUV98011.1 dTMP kinase [Chloracidobacterium sp. E]
MFISFEGIDGCGKTTQAKRLVGALRRAAVPVIHTYEPGGTRLGRHLRQVLLDTRETAPTIRAEILLFAADRAEHVETVIRPALTAGQMVVCDRFADSTRAYQGYGRQISAEVIEQSLQLATQGLEPDLTFLLDLPVEMAVQRLRQRGSPVHRFEAAGLEFHHRVRAGFLALAEQYPTRIRVIDATRSPNDVHTAIWQVAAARLTPPLL